MTFGVEAIVGAIIAGGIANHFIMKRQDKSKLDYLDTRVTKLESTHLEEEKVRRIVQDSLDEYKDDLAQAREDIRELKEVITQLRVDLGILNYLNQKDK